MSPAGLSENQLDLHPHATDAAVGEIAIQKLGRGEVDVPFRNLCELRMVQGIEGVAAKLQSSLLSNQEGSGETHVKVVDPAGDKSIATYGGSIGQTRGYQQFERICCV